MKKLLLCAFLFFVLLLTVACTGGKDSTDNTADETTPVIAPDTDGETEYQPPFDPTNFDPTNFKPTKIPSVNVAREGFALASSSKNDAGFSNLNLNDGDLSTGFSTAWNQTSSQFDGLYIFIDLTKTYAVDSIKLYPMEGEKAGFPNAFDVLTSMDGKKYTYATTVPKAVASADGFEVDLNGVETRFIKILSKQLQPAVQGKGCYMAFGEIEVYASVDTASNAILNRNDIWLFKNPDTACQLNILYYRDGTPVDPNVNLHYVTMDPSVAIVDENGLITPVGFGKTQVYVTDGTNLSVCLVEVRDESVDSFHVESFFNQVAARADHLIEALDLLKAAGIDYLGGRDAYDMLGNDTSAYTVFLCHERGMAYQVADSELLNVLPGIEHAELIRVLQKYEHRAGFYGIYLADEPVEDNFEYAELVRVVNTYNPHIEAYLNQFPITNNLQGDAHENFTYQEIAAISGGNGRLNYISFDHYAYWNSFDNSIFRSLNVMRKAGLLYNCGTAYYLQCFWNRNLTPTEQMYNASMGIAYGFKKYQWFLASCIFNPDTMQPSLMYDGVVAANAYIETVEPILGHSDAIEVYHTNNVIGNQCLPSDFVFQHISGGEAIYSLFEALDGSGKQHIVVTNKNDSANGAVIFTIKVTDGLRDMKILDLTTGEMVPLTVAADGTLTLNIAAAQCAVIELPDGYDASRLDVETNNLALNRPVYVSSTSASYANGSSLASHYLTDGDSALMGWSSNADDKAAWLCLDLGEVCDIRQINVIMSQTDLVWNNSCKSFAISVSADGEQYTEVARVIDHQWNKNDPCMELELDPVQARYIRIDVINATSSAAFGEIEVYS